MRALGPNIYMYIRKCAQNPLYNGKTTRYTYTSNNSFYFLLQVLSDEDKRSLYDHSGEEGLYGDSLHGDIGTHGIDPYELFNTFFGGSDKIFGDSMAPGRFHFSAEVNGNRGLDISYDLLLSFEESILGGKQEINIFVHETCGTCHRTGAKSSNDITECTRCRGQGRLMKTQRTPFGTVSQVN